MKKSKLDSEIMARSLQQDLTGFDREALPTKRRGDLRYCENCEEFYVGGSQCPNCGSGEVEVAFICRSCGGKVNSEELYRSIACHECGNKEFKLHYSKVLYGRSSDFPQRYVAKNGVKCTNCGEEMSLSIMRHETEDVECPNCGSKRFRKTASYGKEYYHRHHQFNLHPIKREHRDEEKKHPTSKKELNYFIEKVMNLNKS